MSWFIKCLYMAAYLEDAVAVALLKVGRDESEISIKCEL